MKKGICSGKDWIAIGLIKKERVEFAKMLAILLSKCVAKSDVLEIMLWWCYYKKGEKKNVKNYTFWLAYLIHKIFNNDSKTRFDSRTQFREQNRVSKVYLAQIIFKQ